MTPAPTEIILASGSPRRRELLGKLGARFEIVPAERGGTDARHRQRPAADRNP